MNGLPWIAEPVAIIAAVGGRPEVFPGDEAGREGLLALLPFGAGRLLSCHSHPASPAGENDGCASMQPRAMLISVSTSKGLVMIAVTTAGLNRCGTPLTPWSADATITYGFDANGSVSSFASRSYPLRRGMRRSTMARQ
jgi:hypothetical protein